MIKTKRILLVEDEVDLRNLYVELLSDKKHIVTEASDGEIAMDYLKESKIGFDLLLLDEMIPKLKGTEILEILKNNKTIKRPKKIMLMTNLDHESIKKKLKDIHCTKANYVIKSEMTPADFIDMVEKELA